MVKINNRNTKTRCEICSKLIIQIRFGVFIVNFGRLSGIFIVNFEHILHLVLVFFITFEHVITDWDAWSIVFVYSMIFSSCSSLRNFGPNRQICISRSILFSLRDLHKGDTTRFMMKIHQQEDESNKKIHQQGLLIEKTTPITLVPHVSASLQACFSLFYWHIYTSVRV